MLFLQLKSMIYSSMGLNVKYLNKTCLEYYVILFYLWFYIPWLHWTPECVKQAQIHQSFLTISLYRVLIVDILYCQNVIINSLTVQNVKQTLLSYFCCDVTSFDPGFSCVYSMINYFSVFVSSSYGQKEFRPISGHYLTTLFFLVWAQIRLF